MMVFLLGILVGVTCYFPCKIALQMTVEKIYESRLAKQYKKEQKRIKDAESKM